MSDPTTFGDLRAIIARELGEDQNDDLDVEITNSMQAAIRHFQEEPLWWLMATDSTLVMTSGARFSETPT